MTESRLRERKSLTSKKEIHAFYHPVRMRILDFLTSEAKSVSEVAEVLRVHPANITHHFRVLEAAGLIKLVEVRHTGRNPAKCFRSVARTFDVISRGKLDNANAKVLTTVRNDVDSGIHNLSGDDTETVLGYLLQKRWSEQTLKLLVRRLAALVEEFSEIPEQSDPLYSLAVGLYPAADVSPVVGKIRIEKLNSQKESKK
jgi:predicted ArsR family transcriptional regulator